MCTIYADYSPPKFESTSQKNWVTISFLTQNHLVPLVSLFLLQFEQMVVAEIFCQTYCLFTNSDVIFLVSNYAYLQRAKLSYELCRM